MDFGLGVYELWSKLQAFPLISPIVIPYIYPSKEFKL